MECLLKARCCARWSICIIMSNPHRQVHVPISNLTEKGTWASGKLTVLSRSYWWNHYFNPDLSIFFPLYASGAKSSASSNPRGITLKTILTLHSAFTQSDGTFAIPLLQLKCCRNRRYARAQLHCYCLQTTNSMFLMKGTKETKSA